MSAALTKRQQARNEKVLHELVQSVPGNNFCADCQARNPGWASWSLGVFLCMRCAALHRKLGTHISKVKSLSMDSWSNEQVENMRKVGNIASNKTYNPQNKKPPVPIDVDEADGAMERFIRGKYMNNALASTRRHNTGSTESDETPPPLPPKTPSRFGLRSASSIFPLGSKAKRTDPKRDPSLSPRDLQPQTGLRQNQNKASQVFGASVNTDDRDESDTERKLAKLRDMGFNDDKRNALVLKGVGGNIEKTVEALVRLGEGDGRSPSFWTSAKESPMSLNRSLTPAVSSASSGREATRPLPSSPSNNNPFDMLDRPPPQPLSSQSTGTLQNKNPYLTANPYGAPMQQSSVGLDMAFRSMSLAPPSQPLFPNHTGGLAAPQPQNPQLYQQAMTPPISSTAQNYQNHPSVAFSNNQNYPPPAQSAMANHNPFFMTQQGQAQVHQPQQPLSVNTTGYPLNGGGNPFTRSPTRIQSPTLNQIPEQSQQNYYTPPAQAQANNPFFAQQQQPPQMPQQYQSPQPPHLYQQMPVSQQYQQAVQAPQPYGYAPSAMGQVQQAAWAPQRPDTASILSLYNYSQPASNPYQTQETSQAPAQSQMQAQGANPFYSSQTFPQAPQQPQQQQQAPAVAGGPAMASNNPFMNVGSGGQTGTPAVTQASLIDAGAKKHNVSRESMMAFGMEWSNGRHSPDAFASLSARDTR
ncbi:hypothetical protein B0T22DRAFT_466384 [Podospora appendiculata]|uniref:UBA domain-containing protein 3 n=1 Tax=Podospora appendiculata TaxID=314037 RepID=A0AAE0X675_9PEZI|nr:hypothetical protein B0T22DRAFT_466384 [Podospora appendiculata]